MVRRRARGVADVSSVGARGDEPVAMTDDGVEFAYPDWVFGLANHQPLGDGRSVASGRSDGRDRLYIVGPAAGQVDEVPLPYTELSSVAVVDDGVVVLAAAPTEATAIVEVALPSGVARVLRQSLSVTIDPTEVRSASRSRSPRPTAGSRTGSSTRPTAPPSRGRLASCHRWS